MRLLNFVFIVIFVTSVIFIHTHQKIEATILSYSIKKNQSELDKLLDRKEELEYNVAKLKAPGYLEFKLAKNDVKLVLPERWQVYQTGPQQKGAEFLSPLFARSIANIFSLNREAHATPANR